MSVERSRATVNGVLQALQDGRAEALDELVAEDVLVHAAGDPGPGREGVKKRRFAFDEAFEHPRIEVLDELAAADRVVERTVVRGRHRGPPLRRRRHLGRRRGPGGAAGARLRRSRAHGGRPRSELQDRQRLRTEVERIARTLPDLQGEVHDLVEDGERVAVRWSATGTHEGPLMEIPATGRRVTVRGMNVLRVAGGRIFEGWVQWDVLDLLRQLGHDPLRRH